MADDMFDGPASRTDVRITDFEGNLLLVKPLQVDKDIPTVFGDANATTCDLIVLDGEHAGEQHKGLMLFQKALQAQLADRVGSGRMLLGRLGKGVAKPGQSPPWLFTDPTEEERGMARAWVAKNIPPF
jgi:hypothetical protein